MSARPFFLIFLPFALLYALFLLASLLRFLRFRLMLRQAQGHLRLHRETSVLLPLDLLFFLLCAPLDVLFLSSRASDTAVLIGRSYDAKRRSAAAAERGARAPPSTAGAASADLSEGSLATRWSSRDALERSDARASKRSARSCEAAME